MKIMPNVKGIKKSRVSCDFNTALNYVALWANQAWCDSNDLYHGAALRTWTDHLRWNQHGFDDYVTYPGEPEVVRKNADKFEICRSIWTRADNDIVNPSRCVQMSIPHGDYGVKVYEKPDNHQKEVMHHGDLRGLLEFRKGRVNFPPNLFDNWYFSSMNVLQQIRNNGDVTREAWTRTEAFYHNKLWNTWNRSSQEHLVRNLNDYDVNMRSAVRRFHQQELDNKATVPVQKELPPFRFNSSWSLQPVVNSIADNQIEDSSFNSPKISDAMEFTDEDDEDLERLLNYYCSEQKESHFPEVGDSEVLPDTERLLSDNCIDKKGAVNQNNQVIPWKCATSFPMTVNQHVRYSHASYSPIKIAPQYPQYPFQIEMPYGIRMDQSPYIFYSTTVLRPAMPRIPTVQQRPMYQQTILRQHVRPPFLPPVQRSSYYNPTMMTPTLIPQFQHQRPMTRGVGLHGNMQNFFRPQTPVRFSVSEMVHLTSCPLQLPVRHFLNRGSQ